MDGRRRKDWDDSLFEFTLSELIEMDNIYKEIGDQSVGQEFCQDIATSFSSSASRAGISAITWKQVQSWFQQRQGQSQAKVNSSSSALKLVADTSDAPSSNNVPESFPSPKGKRVTDLSELAFEAKSSKDDAWGCLAILSAQIEGIRDYFNYIRHNKQNNVLEKIFRYDVGSFLTYRVLSTGELEARVRYAGFGKEDDEWVNVKRGVRERSIPLEPSECQKVEEGDLVLCFQEREDHAVYCDAYVVEVQRRVHDSRGCRCIFIVRYDHDNTQEKVQLGRICCRPKRYAGSPVDTQAEPTQYQSRSTFDILAGVKFPF